MVAIVGRPNVGKSALFNRIAGARIAIVHDESGVTRDRLIREVPWSPAPFDLIDTGGVRLPPGATTSDQIETGIVEQVESALTDAAVAILVVDVQIGLHPLDAEVANRLRRTGIPCYVAVNKCDAEQHDLGAHDFATLGLPLFPVSALHDRGIKPLLKSVTAELPPAAEPTDQTPLKVAVVGRPNAGKSSYINRLLRQPRVIVSEVAGTTRDSITIPFTNGSGEAARHYHLIDTAGMRHLRRIDNAVERYSLIRAEKSISEADVVLLLLDATTGPTMQDKQIAAKIQKAQKGCLLLVNKWDLAMEEGITQTRYEPALREAMPFLDFCPLLFVSAASGYNIRRSLDAIDLVAGEVRRTLPTGPLNRALANAMAAINPPSRGRRRLKIYYATQTGTAPIEIRIFVNDTSLAGSNFTSYLIRCLRSNFGLEGAPVTIRYRSRDRSKQDN